MTEFGRLMDSPFIGRQTQLSALASHLKTAASGQARVCFVTGEAGAGKTALVNAFLNTVQEQSPGTVSAFCGCNAQTGQGEAYLPFVEVLTMLMTGSRASSAPDPGRQRIARLLGISAKTLLEHAPDLVGSLIPGSSALVSMAKTAATEAGWLDRLNEVIRSGSQTDQLERDRIFQQYTELLTAMARKHPLVVAIDDLQWSDAASISLLFYLIRKITRARILFIGTYRPNAVHGKSEKDRHPLITIITETKRRLGDIFIDLDQIPVREKKHFVSQLVDLEKNGLSPEFRERLFFQTNGNPFFVQELLKSFKDKKVLIRDRQGRWQAGPKFDWHALPAKLEGVIEARLGNLSPEMKEVLSVACVEGHEFTVQVIAQALEMKELTIFRLISRELERQHQLVIESGTRSVGGRTVSLYRFHQASMVQYLYGRISQGERMLLHRSIARALEAVFQDAPEDITGRLAFHYMRSGDTALALDHLMVSAKKALKLSAYDEARQFLEDALHCLTDLNRRGSLDDLEFSVLLDLANTLKAIKGWQESRVMELYSRAVDLGTRLKKTRELSPALFGQWAYHLNGTAYGKAMTQAGRYQRQAKALQDREMLLFSSFALCNTLFFMGRFKDSYQQLRFALKYYSHERRADYMAAYGQDPILFILMLRVFLGWVSGRIDTAAHHLDQMGRYAKTLDHPFSQAVALQAAPWHYFHLRDHRQTMSSARELIKLASEYGFPYYEGIGRLFLGWALIGTDKSRCRDGIALIRDGYENKLRARGPNLHHSIYTLLLCDAHLALDTWEKGLRHADQGIAMAKSRKAYAYLAELYRAKGNFYLAGKKQPEAEAHFKMALETAGEQKAVTLQFRAAVSLSRLYMAAGRIEEAKLTLFPFYRLFKSQKTYVDTQEAEKIVNGISRNPEIW